jgi:hypothetical protein
MLFGKTVAFYCENHTENVETLPFKVKPSQKTMETQAITRIRD